MVEGQLPPPPGREPIALTNSVSPEYFDTIGCPIAAGRGILPTDTARGPRVVLINETMARTLFPDGDAIGRRLRPVGGTGGEDPEWAEIVGVARDVRFLSMSAPPTAFHVYKPLAQETWGFVNVTVRAKAGVSAAALVEPFRRVLMELDPDVPALNLMPVPEFIAGANRGLVTINQPAAVRVLLAVSSAACYLPARRATKLDPAVAMRTE